MPKTITVDMREDPDVIMERARRVAGQAGALFEGDAVQGRFAASGLEGGYAVHGGQVAITVTRRPAFMPWSLVESRLRGFFG